MTDTLPVSAALIVAVTLHAAAPALPERRVAFDHTQPYTLFDTPGK